MTWVLLLISLAALPVFLGVCAILCVWWQHRHTIVQVFITPPPFTPATTEPIASADEVSFVSRDGITISGSYCAAPHGPGRAILIFCHAYNAERWSGRNYWQKLGLDAFDLFTFDFRHHGKSSGPGSYRPLHWMSNHEVADIAGALAYVRARPDFQNRPIILFGVSRGGATALFAASVDRHIHAVITDGAFSTQYTQVAYMMRWYGIYSSVFWLAWLPTFIWRAVGWLPLRIAERDHGCRYPHLERVLRQCRTPWLMVHGDKDNYIKPEICQHLFAQHPGIKGSLLVKDARHNGSIDADPEGYRRAVVQFLSETAPLADRIPAS